MAAGLLMLLWCLSGFVMMYHGYPRLAQADRLSALPAVGLGRACDPARIGLAAGTPVADAAVEMVAARPILTLRLEGGAPARIDLATCAVAGDVRPDEVRDVALSFARSHGLPGAMAEGTAIASDQWTLEGAARRGPVRRFSLVDREHTDLYVALRTGELVQRTTRTDRVLGWLGAVPHWLYPTVLRRDGELWSQVVIWGSLAGVFLTVTGLWVGIVRFKRRRSGRWSPYRGWFFWHHVAGLVFGVLTLAWVASGLLTMSPWGLLESPAYGLWRGKLAGSVPAADLARFLSAASGEPSRFVRLELAPLQGRFAMVATEASGRRVRLDQNARPAPLAPSQLGAVVAQLAPSGFDTARLTRPDAYHYRGYDAPPPVLPALRVTLHDAERTLLYLDPVDGRLLRAVDRTERLGRWTRTALHDWDFPLLRTRPLWDGVVLLLLAGVTGVCATGAWLSWRRVAADVSRLRSTFRRRSRS